MNDINPYQSPGDEIVRAELVPQPPRKETFDEVWSKMCRWGGSSFLLIIAIIAASGSQIGGWELLVIGIGYAMYWGPRFAEAAYRPTSRGGR